MTGESKVAFTNLDSCQLDKVLYKLQLTAPDGYDEDGKLSLLRCSKVFCRGAGEYENSDLLAVFSKKGIFMDVESTDGKLKGMFSKSELVGKLMYPCSVCCKEVTDKPDSTGIGLECSGCGWFFHSNCTNKPISLELFNALKNSPNYVKVLCPTCNSVYGSAHSKLRRVEYKMDAMDVKMSKLDTKMSEIAKKSYSGALTSGGKPAAVIPPKVLDGLKSITKVTQKTEDQKRLKRTRVVIRPEDTTIRTSRDIRKAFNKHYQGIVIKHCRLTASGTITFEFDDETVAKSVQDKWSCEFFGGNKGMKVPGDFNTVGIVKYVYDDIPQADMERDILQNYSGQITKCEFLKRKSDQSFNGMIKVECTSREALLKVVEDRIKFCNQRYIIEEFKKRERVIKCSKCQGWGHIHRYCREGTPAKCGKCAQNHETRTCSITAGFKCAHCGKGHMAGSADCSVYKEKAAKFSHDSL